MKVLWISFSLFPEAGMLSGLSKTHKGSGGWLFGSADALLDYDSRLVLRVASVTPAIKEYTFIQGKRMSYYLIPYGRGINKYHHGYDDYWKMIIHEFNPDVVHIHGIESTLALSFLKACGSRNVVCSIQGLFNIISRYMFTGIPYKDLIYNTTLRDLVKGSYFHLQRDSQKRSGYITETMKSGRYFIGRTSWDKAHLWAINPKAEYLFCNETLRGVFYDGIWDYKQCVPHTIFLSSTKGMPVFIKALSLVAIHYPDVKVRIAGGGNLISSSVKSRLRRSGYEKLINRMINKTGLRNHVTFLGPLSAEEMRQEYLNANVFVNPSQIENSSNSVGESQLLGVPTIASYVGGMADMIPEPHTGILYRCEEYEMLAKDICDVFEESPLFNNEKMRSIAMKRHDRAQNARRTLAIYDYISRQSYE